ncbi:RecQ family ATP-dependent DNA helicase [Arcticibacter tournemirensis]
MESIVFFDTEIEPRSKRILDIGGIRGNNNHFHSASVSSFISFIKGTKFICGHNIINHDLKYLNGSLKEAGENSYAVIDTLLLSPLMFPTHPCHALLKDDKLQTEELNNPLNDAIKARDLFFDEVSTFNHLRHELKQIFWLLLYHRHEFSGFFDYAGHYTSPQDAATLIRTTFQSEICSHADLEQIVNQWPVELAYCLALINSKKPNKLLPPWVVRQYPKAEWIIKVLRETPCPEGCNYCNKALDIYEGLKRHFGFAAYRSYGGQPLQEMAVKTAVNNKSLLAVFPTGGGKSITFQVPALMAGENSRALTVVISPLQSLMKDQVDNLEKAGSTAAVTINGLLDPIERAKSFERVEDGSASILYISPESLRSVSIERLLLGRKIARFVIDEAHCFSSWGQDFRVDYLYIGDFIRSLQEKKNSEDPIPVSCFTATAKRKVIEDILLYFKEKLSLDLEVFRTGTSRTNLHYRVLNRQDDTEKYNTLRGLIAEKDCPTIVYVSRTKRAGDLADQLTKDGFTALPYHGKMESSMKIRYQNDFLSGSARIMVATSAFGMGVDKKDVGMVIHYDISDSLENYVQEAGRAGRDENITAECYVLYNDDDLSKHFILHNQTKLGIKEIQQVWKAIKDLTKFRSAVSNSALEIARKAGWDDTIAEIETRVTTAIAALEDAGYIQRKQNMPRVFATSIVPRNAQDAIDKIRTSPRFNEEQRASAVRIIRKLFSAKSRKHATGETAESRIDYISDHLGITREKVIEVINLLREENILADSKDLTAFIRKGESRNRSLSITETFFRVENFLLSAIHGDDQIYSFKELNEQAEEKAIENVTPNTIQTILNFWSIKKWISKRRGGFSKNHLKINWLISEEQAKEKFGRRRNLAGFIIGFLYSKAMADSPETGPGEEEILVEFSELELITEYNSQTALFQNRATSEDIEDALFYLSRIGALKLEGGFLVIYNKLTIDRLEKNNRAKYTLSDYQKLSQFYENKVQQIHIVGEYAQKMVNDYKSALEFVDDYFQLNYSSFLNKYFKGDRQTEIKRTLTPAKFRQIVGDLSPAQLGIINDNTSKYIVVAAGPGSGKTRVLVHKLASLAMMEDIKLEHLLMIAFSRAAVTEFKKRLIGIIGNAANFIEIKTFHSYCFDLTGRVGNLEKSKDVIKEAVLKIRNGDVETSRITKTVLVIDEAQDMDADEYALVEALIQQNEDMRVIAVGDDDQNIYTFRGASSEYMEKLISEKGATKYELIENYRSENNLVQFTNKFAENISHRLKASPIVARRASNGTVRLISYNGGSLITPLVNDVLNTDLAGSTCVLTRTNEDALLVAGLLLKHNRQIKLVQAEEGINLRNLVEIRFFLKLLDHYDDVFIIQNEHWKQAIAELTGRFSKSSRLEMCLRLLKDFEEANTRAKYRSDLETFIIESKPEDFTSVTEDSILVSTIHQAKGKEFDQVFVLPGNCHPYDEDTKRLLYVGMTRAKKHLSIHTTDRFLQNIKGENIIRIKDDTTYPPPNQILLQLTYKDVWLDYFISRQQSLSRLTSGDLLLTGNDTCKTSDGIPVLVFSKKFQQTITDMQAKGFTMTSARINYILYWTKEETEQEIKIVLPEVILRGKK